MCLSFQSLAVILSVIFIWICPSVFKCSLQLQGLYFYFLKNKTSGFLGSQILHLAVTQWTLDVCLLLPCNPAFWSKWNPLHHMWGEMCTFKWASIAQISRLWRQLSAWKSPFLPTCHTFLLQKLIIWGKEKKSCRGAGRGEEVDAL